MEIIHGLLDLVFIFRVFSSLLLASTLVSWGYEAILDVLIGINQIETQTRQTVMLVSSLLKLGNESRLYKIIVLKHRFLDILIYSTVEYTIEYMYKFIVLRSKFCTLNLVIFKSGQSPYGPRKWPKPVCGIVFYLTIIQAREGIKVPILGITAEGVACCP